MKEKARARHSSIVGIELSKVIVDGAMRIEVEFIREVKLVVPFKLGWFSSLFPIIFEI